MSERVYHVHGLRVRSEWTLPFRTTPAPTLADLALLHGSPRLFARALVEPRVSAERTTWTETALLADGRVYLRWTDRFEVLVSADGTTISGRTLDRRGGSAFIAHLLARAFSFALLKQGFDPLHATVVAVRGEAVALLGDAGEGKSSLAASLVRSGHRLLTDDLLVLSRGEASFVAHAGPPLIKLFPEIARRVLGSSARGTPMANGIPKLVIPLGRRETASAMPLKAMYELARPRRRTAAGGSISIRPLSKRRACLALIGNTFNAAVTDPARLARQLALASDVAAAVPIRRLVYPRTLAALPAVRDRLLADVSGLRQ